MKANRAEINRIVDKPASTLRLLLLHGPDDAGSHMLGARFEAALGKDVERLDLAPTDLKGDPARLADEAAATSMFGSSTLIRVDGIGDESVEAVKALFELASAGNPVLAYAGALRRDSKLLKLVEAAPADIAFSFASYPPEGQEAENEAQALCRAEGLRVTRDVIHALLDAAGGERGIISREITKLALYLDASPEHPKSVEPEVVTALVAGLSESDIGALVDSVIGGNPAEMERQLASADALGLSGIVLIRALLRRLHMLASLRAEIDAGQSIERAIAAMGKAVFWKDRKSLTSQAARWRTPNIARAISALMTAEREIKKSGTVGDVAAAQTLVALTRHAARIS